MLTEYDLENKIINDDGSVKAEDLKRECRGGVKASLRHIVYRLLMLGLEHDYTSERESRDVEIYDKLCEQVRSGYSQGQPILYKTASGRQTDRPFDLLLEGFPEYFSSKNGNDACHDYVFIPDPKKSVSMSLVQDVAQTVHAPTGRKTMDLDSSYTQPLIDLEKGSTNICDETRRNVKQIRKDVERISPQFKILKLNEEYDVDVSYIYENVLILYSELFQSTYMQGAESLMVPLIYNFVTYGCSSEKDLKKAEASAFLCYAVMIKGLKRDIEDNQATMISRIKTEMKAKEPAIYDHLFSDIEISLDGLLVRWLNCLFLQEFAFDDCLRIFDFMFSYEPQKLPRLLLYISVAIFGDYKDKFVHQDPNQCGCLELIFAKGRPFTKGASPRDIERIIKKARHYMEEEDHKN
ncbi:uncharacterized protein VICG_00949 [Vittaforma corneae ATCC 50505]|uniref:Rab-GAP TBC domain-containing protein n=1 Tax=Vittaforma corneae (strain ATCC 50505) TaxID=993615 RepID=L2GNN3_VITCO|nr:uncharacterized protein VICG_00949 [Vittaforma corneae ATCC 50505]ELA41932.1 hypothetical protein VICG_00949 [Vittaforma corneae ATCC 50505]